MADVIETRFDSNGAPEAGRPVFLQPLVVNICSTARSGSTLLDLVLGNGDGVLSCGEVCAAYRPYRRHHFNPSCSCGKDDCSILSLLQGVRESDFHASAARQLGAGFIVDSSKELHWVFDNNRWAEMSGMSVVNILLWKDPVDLAYSLWKRGEGGLLWREYFVSYYGRAIGMGMPYVSVNFNEFRAEPARYGRLICDFIGMPWFEGKERFWESEPHYLFGSAGTGGQVGSGSSNIRAKESYPDEFMPFMQEVRNISASDDELSNIIGKLRQYDITGGRYRQAPDSAWHSRTVKPLWYYRSRAWRFFRRVFPLQLQPKKEVRQTGSRL